MFKPLFADDSPKQLPIEPEKTPAPSRTLDHRFSGAHPISSSSFVHLLAILLVALSTWRWGNNDKDLQGPTMIETFRATMITTFKATMIKSRPSRQQWSRPSGQQWSRPSRQQWSRPSRPNNQLLPSSHSTWLPILNVSSMAEKRSKKAWNSDLSLYFCRKDFLLKEKNTVIVDLWQKLKNSEKLQRSHATAKHSQDREILKRCWNIEFFNQNLKQAVI